jgi:hypothetical protein
MSDSHAAAIRLSPVAGCDCTEPHPSYYVNKGAFSAEATARGIGKMLCAREFGCSRLHPVERDI